MDVFRAPGVEAYLAASAMGHGKLSQCERMITEREKTILGAVVQEYIRTAEPVSSRAIAGGYSFGVSPATIRSVMHELESEGLLAQPHTSAGRIPTERGFRLFVDGLLDLEEPGDADKDVLKKSCGCSDTVESMLSETARALSALTGCAGMMFLMKKDVFVIKHISVMPMGPTSVLVVMVSSLGMVTTKHIKLGAEAARLNLERISNYLNSIGKGHTIRDLRSRIVEEMKKEKSLYDELLSGALKLGVMAVEGVAPGDEGELFLEGRLKVLDQPEFRDDFERMKQMFAAFEEKSLIVKIIDRSLDDCGISILLGSEGLVSEFDGLGFVTAPYGDGAVAGALGVIGPVRMDYPRIIPLVEYAAGLVGKSFF